jgi:hypothetical protein
MEGFYCCVVKYKVSGMVAEHSKNAYFWLLTITGAALYRVMSASPEF